MNLTIFVDNLNLARRCTDHFAIGAADHHLARINRHLALHTGAADRRLRPQQRHSLALHVRTHQRAVHVVMLQERNQRGRHADHLFGRDVHVVHAIRRAHDKLALVTGKHTLINKFAVLIQFGISLRDPEILFVVSRAIVHFLGHERANTHIAFAQRLLELGE